MELLHARTVELFDAHITLTKHPYENLLHEFDTFAVWQIDGQELDQLFQHLDLPVVPVKDWHFDHKRGERVADHTNLADRQMPLLQYVMNNPYAEFNTYKIEAIRVEEVSGGLNVEVHGHHADEPVSIDSFSYRGRYLIMWDDKANETPLIT